MLNPDFKRAYRTQVATIRIKGTPIGITEDAAVVERAVESWLEQAPIPIKRVEYTVTRTVVLSQQNQ